MRAMSRPALSRRATQITVARSGRTSIISRIYVYPSEIDSVETGQAATIELADQVDVGRGDILAPVDALPEVADQFAAHVVWLNENPMLPGRTYTPADRHAFGCGNHHGAEIQHRYRDG